MSEEIKTEGKKFYKKWWFWVVVLIVLFIIGSGSNENNPKKIGDSGDTVPVVETEQNELFKIGDKIQLGSSILTINNIEYSKGGQYIKPVEGNEWVNLNITIENTGSSQQYVTTLGQMFIRDGEGNSYQVAVTNKSMENPGLGLDGAVIAKSKRTGWVGFEIKKNVKGLQFQYNGSILGGESILVDLGR